MPIKDLWFRFLPCCLVLMISSAAYSQTNSFDYKRYLFGTPPTLTLSIQTIYPAIGVVIINGNDTQAPTTPFIWRWGDGEITTGFFPQSHAYQDHSKNFIVEVIATYPGGTTDSSEILVRFSPPTVTPVNIPAALAVTIAQNKRALGTRLYEPPVQLTGFDDRFFTTISRSTLEYVLSVCAVVENDFVNGNIDLFDDKFEQIMLRDPTSRGAYSLWYTDPVAFGVGDAFLQSNIGYSSLFHEMGHNFTLNTPAAYYYGGRIDGDANAIFSECMANIFQHAAGYEIVNNYQLYGLSADLAFDIQQSVVSSIGILRAAYDRYINSGKPFASWNDPNTQEDETFDTFMTLAYTFMEQAEQTGRQYRGSLKRMMQLLQGFNPAWEQKYAPSNNTASADTFRATLMTTAISYAFNKNLRSDFRLLNFPISDAMYDELYRTVTAMQEESKPAAQATFTLRQNYPNPFNPLTTISFNLPLKSFVVLKVFDALGKEVTVLLSGVMPAGTYTKQWNAGGLSSGVYYCHFQAGSHFETEKLIVLK